MYVVYTVVLSVLKLCLLYGVQLKSHVVYILVLSALKLCLLSGVLFIVACRLGVERIEEI